MKKAYSFLLILILLISLLGCEATKESDNTPVKPPIEETLPTETESPIKATEATAPAAQPPADTSYLQKVERADQSIFDGPGYDYIFVGTVEVAGTYTIVEEAEDAEGNLWGKLKSGVGWIDLTQVRSGVSLPVTANYADNTLLSSGNYHHCIADTSEYAVQIAFRATEVLRNISLCSMEFVGDTYQVDEVLYYLEEMQPDMPLVADVAFPGDMSMYAFHFTDSSGVSHSYGVYISGRNGSLVLTNAY